MVFNDLLRTGFAIIPEKLKLRQIADASLLLFDYATLKLIISILMNNLYAALE